MKINFTKSRLLTGLATLLVAVGALVVLSSTSADGLNFVNRSSCTDDEIIRCGVTSQQDLVNKYDQNHSDVQNIFTRYGITRGDITGQTSEVKLGTVYQDGRVVVDGKTVATGAYSLSRVKFHNQAKHVVVSDVTLYEGPNMSIFVRPVEAFIYFKNGQFHRGVLVDCANPLVATPTKPPTPPKPKPAYSCDNLTARKIERNKFEFTSTASASNGAEIVSYNYDFGDGTVLNNQPRTVTHTYDTTAARTYGVTMTVNIRVDGAVKTIPGSNCKATVKVDAVPPKPAFKCENLSATKISRTEFRFNAAASAQNATIRSYTFNFGDGNSSTVETSATTASVNHTYSGEARSYTAEVIVTMSDGSTAARTENCKTTVKVDEKQVPSISIEKTVNGKKHDKVAVGTEFTYEITVRNTGNVVLKDAAVRDNAPSQVTLISADRGIVANNVWTYTIPELAVGGSESFAIKAKYDKYAEGVHKNKVCVDTPTIPSGPDDCDDATTETDEPIKVCDLTDNTIKTIERSEFDEATMTTDLTQCDDIKVCIIKDKTIETIKKHEFDESTMTTDLSKCEELETPPELPQTGIENFISGGIGLGSITAAGYYWLGSRRNLLSALLNK